MTKPFFIFLLVIMFTSCETKQWNLNKTIGWKSKNPEDYTVLYLKWSSSNNDSNQINIKTNLDNQILEELKLKNLGDVAEKDDSTDTDLHFLVRKDYKKALKAIVSIAKSKNITKALTVCERRYESWDKWNDQAIYTLGK